MPTRIKRYEERLEQLDELLARIEAEMGPDAEVERRDFTRGKFLGLFGGTRMVELVATVEVPAFDAVVQAAPTPGWMEPAPSPRHAAPFAGRASAAVAPSAPASAPPPPSAAPPAPPLAAPMLLAPAAQAGAPQPKPEAAVEPQASAEHSGIQELKDSIRELHETMRLLIEQQRAAQAPSHRPTPPSVAEPPVAEAATATASAPRAGPATVVDPAAVDPAMALESAPRAAYDRLLDWNIGPYDALELINVALSVPDAPPPRDGEELLARVSRDICRNVLLAGGIKLHRSPPGKVVALIGATGVGKTTTIAKLAAYFAFQQSQRVSLVSLDNYRIAAAEQLRTYTEIMGIDLDIVFSRDEFDQVLTVRRQNDLVLIDTAGRSPLNTKQIYELRDIFGAHPPDEVHLVLAAPTKADDLRLILESFLPLAFDYIVVSKLDETRSLGCLYNINRYASAIAGRNVPISYFTVGQSVPEDLRAAELPFIQAWIEQGRIV
jgi:flagellar biosynthesis protein FlhF